MSIPLHAILQKKIGVDLCVDLSGLAKVNAKKELRR